MSQSVPQPFSGTDAPVRMAWWQKPVVAIATVVVVTGITGGVAYAATRGDSGSSTQQQGQFPGGGQFPGAGGQGGGVQPGQQGGQFPGSGGQGGVQPGQQGQTGQTSRDSGTATT